MDVDLQRDLLDALRDVYDSVVWPLWAGPFAHLLVQEIKEPLNGPLLELFCATGQVSLHLFPYLGEQARLLAQDPSIELLEAARLKGEDALKSRRLFFQHNDFQFRLRFPDETFDLVYSNLGLSLLDDPSPLLQDIFRVLKPGQRTLLTLPLQGSLSDLFNPALSYLSEQGESNAAAVLQRQYTRFLSPSDALRKLHACGFEGIEVEQHPFRISFDDSFALFSSPFVQHLLFAEWFPSLRHLSKAHVLRDLTEIFTLMWPTKNVDLRVFAGVLHGRKPKPKPLIHVPKR